MSSNPGSLSGPPSEDPSHGYEARSEAFIAARARSTIGVATVCRWAQQLPPGSDILDLGCGHGVPITAALVDMGFALHAIDASPSMVAAFHARFPDIPVECASAIDSACFDRTFDGVVAWGLLFLLSPADQARLIRRMAAALKPGGRLLFTAPWQTCVWNDILTERESVSLGLEEYRRMLMREHLQEIEYAEDEGGNHYYSAMKPFGRPPDPSRISFEAE